MTAERQMSHRAKLRFERLPSAYTHPERIGSLLPDGLPTNFRDRLMASARSRCRLSALLARHVALPSCMTEDLETPEGRFARLEDEDLENALRRIGAIWHARKIRNLIMAEPLRQLIEQLGRDNHRTALRLIDLSPEDDPANGDGEAASDVDGLMGWIERDGLIAVNAWCRHQPAALALRLRLKLRPCPEADDEPPARHRDLAVAIVDHVVMTLAAEARGTVGGHG
ncbi:MAG: SctK family type III secretion system sorting platform protein [Geminicoccaceae bacterium]